MAPKYLDNLLPAGAGERREADYPCFAVTLVIMYHPDGSTANTSWVLARPSVFRRLLFIRLPQRVGGLWLLASALQPQGSSPKHLVAFTVTVQRPRGRDLGKRLTEAPW